MKRTTLLIVALSLALALSLAVIAAQPKTYQVTGTVKSVAADMIVVDKGSETWQLGRDAGTKVTGDLKVGAKVTIEYRMTAATVTVKK
jgi:hypothetical protein